MILADKIIMLRKKAGWSQEELAAQLGVSRQSVSKWEGAQSVPSYGQVAETRSKDYSVLIKAGYVIHSRQAQFRAVFNIQAVRLCVLFCFIIRHNADTPR